MQITLTFSVLETVIIINNFFFDKFYLAQHSTGQFILFFIRELSIKNIQI